MNERSTIGIFGGDMRQVYIAQNLASKGYPVYIVGLMQTANDNACIRLQTFNELLDKCNILIGPIPFGKNMLPDTTFGSETHMITALADLLTEHHLLIGGMIPSVITQICNVKHTPCYDLLKNEEITILNAIATAEASIMHAIQSSHINLHGSVCLILGYGRCAKVLAAKLKGLDARVTIAARAPQALAYAQTAGHQAICLTHIKTLLPSCDFIFNTVPFSVLDKDCLALVKPEVVIIDIASAPGGVDFEFATQQNINAKLYPGLPGKIAPKASADILVDEIIKLLKERSD